MQYSLTQISSYRQCLVYKPEYLLKWQYSNHHFRKFNDTHGMLRSLYIITSLPTFLVRSVLPKLIIATQLSLVQLLQKAENLLECNCEKEFYSLPESSRKINVTNRLQFRPLCKPIELRVYRVHFRASFLHSRIFYFVAGTCWPSGAGPLKLCMCSAMRSVPRRVSLSTTSSWFYSQSYNPGES